MLSVRRFQNQQRHVLSNDIQHVNWNCDLRECIAVLPLQFLQKRLPPISLTLFLKLRSIEFRQHVCILSLSMPQNNYCHFYMPKTNVQLDSYWSRVHDRLVGAEGSQHVTIGSPRGLHFSAHSAMVFLRRLEHGASRARAFRSRRQHGGNGLGTKRRHIHLYVATFPHAGLRGYVVQFPTFRQELARHPAQPVAYAFCFGGGD